MSKDIKEYLHYYLGQQFMMTKPSYHAVHEFGLSSDTPFAMSGKFADYFHVDAVSAEVKPILRKLESMTEEEAKVLAEFYSEWAWRKSFEVTSLDLAGASVFITIYYQLEGAPHGIGDGEYTEQLIIGKDTIWARSYLGRNNFKIVLNSHKMTHYLLSRGFDLFGLIDAGLAIDKETLKG